MRDDIKDVGQRLDAMLHDASIPETVKVFRAQQVLAELGAPYDRMTVKRVGTRWRLSVKKREKREVNRFTKSKEADDLPF